MANETRKKLYTAVNNAGFDIGDYNDFDKRMNNAEDRKKFYDAVNDAGFDIGDYNDYERRIAPSKYNITIGGKKTPVSEKQYKDFVRRHSSSQPASGTQQLQARKVQPQAKAQAKPQTATPTATTQGGFTMPEGFGEADFSRGVQSPFLQEQERKAHAHDKQLAKQGLLGRTEQQKREASAKAQAKTVQKAIQGDEDAVAETGLDSATQQLRDRMDYYNATGKELKDDVLDLTGIGIAPTVARDENGEIMRNEDGTVIKGQVSDPVRAATQAMDSERMRVADLDRQIEEANDELLNLKKEIDKIETPGYVYSQDALSPYADPRTTNTDLASLSVAYTQLQEKLKGLQVERAGGQKGFFNGMLTAAKDPSTWLLGLDKLSNTVEMLRVSEKVKSGQELTDSEKKMLDATMANNAVQGKLSEDSDWLYRAGAMTTQMIPFALQIGFTGGFGSVAEMGATGGEKLAARYAAKYGEEALINRVNANIIRGLGVTFGDVAAGFCNAVTTGAANTAVDAMERRMGDLGVNEKGEYQFTGDDDWIRAIGKAVVSQTKEFATERFGEHLPSLREMNVWFAKQGMGARKIARALSGFAGTKAMQNTAAFLRKGGINGVGGEILEEEIGLPIDVAIGDMTWEDALSGKIQWDICGGMLLSMGAMHATGLAAQGVGKTYNTAQYYKYKNRADRSAHKAATMMGNDAWRAMQEKIDGTETQNMETVWEDIRNNESLSDKEKRAAFDYMNALTLMRGYNMGMFFSASEAAKNPALMAEVKPTTKKEQDEIDVMQSRDRGYNLETPQEQNDAKNMRDYARQQLEGHVSGELISRIDEDPLGTLEIIDNSDLSDEAKQKARDYANAKATYDGMIQSVRDRIETETQQATEEIDSRVASEEQGGDGKIHPATMKADNRQVYIVSGNVRMLDDGSMVDHENSDKDLIVRDAETGKVEFVSIDDILRTDEVEDAEQLKQEAVQNIQETVATEASNAIDGVLSFEPNSNFTIMSNDGVEHTVQVVQDQGDGTVAVLIDGAIDAVPMVKEQLQEMSEAYNISRLQQYEAEKAVERTEEAQEQSETAEGAEEVAEGAEGTPAQETPTEEEDPMPMIGEGEDAEPDFASVTPERAHKYVYEESGLDEQTADEFVANNAKAAKTALDKAVAKKPKIGTNIAKYNKEKAQYEANVQAAQEQVDYWNGVKAQRDAVIAQRNAERAAERKVIEEREKAKAEAEEAARQAEIIARQEEEQARGANTVGEQVKQKWNDAPKVEGSETEITLQNGERVKGRYMLVESGAATASHDARNGFARSEGFPVDESGQTVNDRDYERDKDAQSVTRSMGEAYDSRAIQDVPVVSRDGVVLSGNGRTMAGEIAAQNGTDGAYTEHLRNYGSQYGFTQKQVDGMQHPRLVFVPEGDMPYTTETFAKFNEQAMKSQSKTEKAVKMGKVVDDATYNNLISMVSGFDSLSDFYNSPKGGAQAVNVLQQAGVVNEKQMAELYDGEKLSEAGRALLESVLIGKAFEGNADMVRMLSEFPSLRRSVVQALTEIGRNKQLGNDYNVADELAEAVKLAYNARKQGYTQGQSVSAFARQLNLFPFDEGSETVADYTNATILMLADALNDNRETLLRNSLALYNDAANDAAAGQLDIFGGGVRSKETIIKDVLNFLNNGERKEQRAALNDVAERRKANATSGAGSTEENGTDGASDEAGAVNEGATVVDPRNMSDEEKKKRGDMLRNAPAVDVAVNQITATKEKSARKVAEEWWDNNVSEPQTYETEAGEVEINRNSVESSLAHRYGQAKLDAITSLVEGFENAVYLGTMPDSTRQEGVVNHYFAYPINYNGKRCYVFCRALHDNNTNRLYVHEVFIEENIKKGNTLQTAASQPHGGVALYRDILANVLDSSDGKVTNNSATVQEKEQENVPETIKNAEQETNTNPTEAQKEAGNYKKGHVRIDGFDVTIENPKGTVRRGTDASGKKWSITMQNTYGYIRGTEGVDGDHIDVFLSDNPTEGNVFVVDQVNKDGSFDEHKVMYGFPDAESARRAYLANYEEGWQGLGAITPVSKEEFKKWINSSHRKTKPFAEYSSVKPLGDTQLGEQPNKPTVKAGEDYVSAAERQTEQNESDTTSSTIKENGRLSEIRTKNPGRVFGEQHEDGSMTFHDEDAMLVSELLGREFDGEDLTLPKKEADKALQTLLANGYKAGVYGDEYKPKYDEYGNLIEQKKPAEKKTTKPKKDASAPKISGTRISGKGKIDDVGERLEGARKDMLKVLSKTFEDATVQALIELPFSKAFKKPDLKKAVESGALREEDALFYETLFALMNTNKPKVTKSELWKKKNYENYETSVDKWAKQTHNTLSFLKEFVEATPEQRDIMMRTMMENHYPERDKELADIEQRKRWNKDYTYVDADGKEHEKKYEWGDKTTPNTVWVMHEILSRLGYEVGDKMDIPYGVIKASADGLYFGLTDNKNDKNYAIGTFASIEDAIDTAVYLAKVKRGDTDLQHPKRLFSVVHTKTTYKDSGKYRVVYGRNLNEKQFDSKEEADKFVKEKEARAISAYASPIQEVDERTDYVITFYHPLTGKKMQIDNEKFATKAEALAYLSENMESVNEAVNEKLRAEAEQKGQKKEITADDMMHVSYAYDVANKTASYAVYMNKEVANNYGMPAMLRDGFQSREEAKRWLEEYKAEVFDIYKKAEAQRKAYVYFSSGQDTRVGEDYRNGKDVTAEDFMNEFGFRGVQFGNWTNQTDRQMAINQAYDALIDMAHLLGVSPKALSLDGKLGIAFGSRGSGNANAHFERDEFVINLTKTRGAGSLAHEWWHALDSYFAKQAGMELGMVTEQTSLEIREELREAYNNLVDAIKETDYYERSRKSGSYWGSIVEVTARLFAEWVDRELKKRGELNTFLSRGADEERWQQMMYDVHRATATVSGKEPMTFEEFKQTKESLRGYPYPSTAEVEELGDAVRNIFETVQERIDEESGNVALFHKASEEASEVPEQEGALRDALVETMRNAGIEVVADEQEGQRVLDMVNGGNATLSKAQKRAAETASLNQTEGSPADISTADGTKVLNNLDKLAKDYDNLTTNNRKSFLNDVAEALGAKKHGSNSQYATFETKNGQTVTIRLANHNAKVSTFDNHGEDNGISIVVSKRSNNGITNDGKAHVVEFFYPEIGLRKADGKPLADIVRAIKQSLYSGEFNDPTGIAERQEVNDEQIRLHKVFHGSGADFDAFDHSFIGTGEGSQVFGWGTYVSEVEGVGKTYANIVGGTAYKGIPYKNVNDLSGKVTPEEYEVIANFDRMGFGWDEISFEDAKKQTAEELTYLRDEDFKKRCLATLDAMQEDDFESNRILYTVEIPEDDGSNYIDYFAKMQDQQGILDKIDNYMTSNEVYGFKWKRQNPDQRIQFRAGNRLITLTPNQSGADLYEEFKDAFGAKAASEILHAMGITGIKVPVNAMRGGNEKGEMNFVIFNEEDAKITDKVKFFRTANGKAYGFVKDGKMYIDPSIATSETPIHEYTHLWAEALRKGNPEKWEEIKRVLLNDESVKPFIDKVRREYPELTNEDDLLDEVLAQYSGKRGSERLRAEAQRIADSKDGAFEKADVFRAMNKLKDAIRRFWQAFADFMHVPYRNADEIADRVMYDLLSGVNPRQEAEKMQQNPHKARQLEIVTKENPMRDDYHTGIRSIDDIKTYEEAVNEGEGMGMYPDFTEEDARKALESGEVTVYSSYPIENGVFVSTSRKEAEDYAGGGKVYSKRVPLSNVAWLQANEGQYAEVDDKGSEMFRDEEDIEAVNEKFNKELDDFKEKKHQGLMHLGNPLEILRACGVNAKNLTLSPTVLHRHLKEHGLTVEDLKGLAKAVQTPILVYAHGKNHPNMVVVTEMDVKGGKLSVSLELDKYGNVVEISNIRSIHSKDAMIEMERLSEFSEEELKEALRWVDKEKVSDWLLRLPYEDEHTKNNPKQLSVAKVIKDFENPKLLGENFADKEENTMQREGDGRVLSMSQDKNYSRKQRWELMQREWKRMQNKAKEYIDILKLDRIAVYGTVEDMPEGMRNSLSERKKKAKGWYDTKTGKIVIILGNHRNAEDVAKTILHEAVAHYGLRKLFGKNFDTFLDNVYQNADVDVKMRIADMAARQRAKDSAANRARRTTEDYLRIGTEEYLAKLAEEMDFENRRESFWSKIKSLFIQMLESIGLKDYEAGELSDNELKYILWRSYKNLSSPGEYRNVFDVAEDIVMQENLGVGNYAESQGETMTEQMQAAEEKPRERNIESVNNHFNEQLMQLSEATADHIIFSLGYPSDILKAAGVEDKPMKLYGNKVIKKMKKHGFSLEELRDLPRAVSEPIAVFNNYGKEGNRAILTELKTDNGNILVTITLGKGDIDIDFNIVSSVFGKSYSKIIDWFNKGFATYINKEKALDYLHHSAPIAEALSNPRLGSAAKVINNFENPKFSEEKVEDDELFRDAEERDRVTARDMYERMVSSGRYQFQEAVQDSMLGLKALYKAVLGKNTNMEDVPGNENAYVAENLMSSATAAEQSEYFIRYMKPLIETIHKLCGSNKKAREELTNYLMAKHGLERNRILAERDFKEYQTKHPTGTKTLADFRERDYAGLTALTEYINVSDAEAEAQRMVDAYEQAHDVTELWQNIKAANEATLTKLWLSGVLSRERYDQIRDMFEYYIPLQGFDEKTSDEVYGYLTSKNGPLMGSPIKRAKGRSSKADDPIATMGLMADKAIQQGNRNRMKICFLNFVQNHPSDLVSVNRLWLKYDDVTDEWVPMFADISPEDTAEEVEQKVEQFEQKMQALAQADPDHYKHGKEAQNIPYKVVSGNLREHQVLVKRAGETYVLTINGNPRAAQALNGLTNPDVEQNGVIGKLLSGAEYINRQLSAFYTTRNPDFVASNFLRDMIYSNCMSWAKEGANYGIRFNKNFAIYNPVRMARLYKKWGNGTLDMGNKTESLFYEFMKNGGETGYTNVRDLEAHKRSIAQELKRQGNTLRAQWHALGELFDLVNRSVENTARFAAFVTSKELGRATQRAVYDAKEISVNFNKKGSGSKMLGTQGLTALGTIGAYVSGICRLAYVFWNAGVQGTTNLGKAIKRRPKSTLTGLASMFALGYIVPTAAAILAGGGGDDDDDDKNDTDYWDLPEYVRRSNICFKVSEDNWIKIPLPIEFRAMYGLGEITAGTILGRERYSNSELAFHLGSQVSQILPLDVLEGGGGWHAFIPSVIKPLVEAAENRSWTGMPIYRDSPFNENDPEWTKAYSNTNKTLVSAAEWLNEISGGDKYKKGAIDINPAQVEYMLNGYFGGVSSTINKLANTAEMIIGERDFDWRNVPIANRVLTRGDERTEQRKIRNDYFKYKERCEETKRLLKKYEAEADNGVFEYAERLNFLNNSKDYGLYEIYDEIQPDINSIRKEMKDATDEERKGLEKEERALQKEMVLKMRALEDAK